MRRLRLFIVVGVLGVVVAGASTASGATRYASPAGSGLVCTAENPCDIKTAIVSASPGDTVMLAEGVYSGRADNDPATYSPGEVLKITNSITVQGATTGVSLSKGARIFGTSWDVVVVEARNVRLNDLLIYGSNSTTTSTHALSVQGDGARISRVVALAYGGDACFLQGDNIVVSFTLCRGGSSGIFAYTHIGQPAREVTLNNVTASASRGLGIRVRSVSGALGVTLVNSTARADQADMFDIDASSDLQGRVSVSARTSNFRTVNISGMGAIGPIPAAGTNTDVDPAFGYYSPFSDQYYRLGPSSPPIMVTGGTPLASGHSDYDAFGAGVDATRPPIGAYAYATGQSLSPEPSLPDDVLDQIGGGAGAIATPTTTPTPTSKRAAITVTRPRTTVRRKSIRIRTRANVSNAGTIVQRITIRRGKRVRTICRTRRNVLQARTVTLTCTLGRKTRNELRAKKLRLAIITTFTADTTPKTEDKKIRRTTLKRRR